jgi:uncharacterized protein (DUF362 family)
MFLMGAQWRGQPLFALHYGTYENSTTDPVSSPTAVRKLQLAGARTLLKPNAVGGKAPPVTTDPGLVKALRVLVQTEQPPHWRPGSGHPTSMSWMVCKVWCREGMGW